MNSDIVAEHLLTQQCPSPMLRYVPGHHRWQHRPVDPAAEMPACAGAGAS